ncbi:hypothetical protein [Mangrovivirga cuniculi]|uniref:Uncharacterized protein n=1 Tax=Mangrovivirga cuniculi TaxID=2715131 RepID=A0A4D7JFS9_9BACT|nr:hypothetical protein [Mangrovivirga cuniculi]QCK15039.1 hypothetical protein DCC35_09915 [Mangrovivirga cuniculi]
MGTFGLNEVKSVVTQEFIGHLSPVNWIVRDENYGLWIEKETSETKDFIYFTIKDHYDEKHLSKYHLARPSASRRFHRVEKVLSECFDQFDEMDKATIFPFDYYDGGMDNRLPPPLTGVVNEEELKRDVEIMKEYLDQYILPFFIDYPTLKEVDAKIQQIPIVDLHKFIGQEVIGRRMVIMKLAGNPGYEEYVKMILDYFEGEAKKGNAEAKADLEKYTKLKEYLANN